MPPRRIEAFFYGLFMEADLLRAKGVNPTNSRPASVPGFALRSRRRSRLRRDLAPVNCSARLRSDPDGMIRSFADLLASITNASGCGRSLAQRRNRGTIGATAIWLLRKSHASSRPLHPRWDILSASANSGEFRLS